MKPEACPASSVRALEIFRGLDDAIAEWVPFVGVETTSHPSGYNDLGRIGFDTRNPGFGFPMQANIRGDLDSGIGALVCVGDHFADG